MAAEDLLVHVHIPKCAGTSLWYWMARHNPGSHGFLYPNVSLQFAYDEAALAGLGIGDVALRCMSSHSFRIYPERCAGRRMRYFTLLREPLAHFISNARYTRKTFADLVEPDQLALVPPRANELSLREIAAWTLEHPADIPFRENYQTNYLASCVWRERTGRGPKIGTVLPMWDPDDWAAYRAERLAVAKEQLARFAAVGVVERMAESLVALRRATAQWGLDLGPLDDVGHINANQSEPRDTDWIRDDDPVGRKLLASLDEDRQLYAFAAHLLDAHLART